MIEEAHPNDILVVAWLNEATQYPAAFQARQVISTNATQALQGRRIRRAYLTPGCGSTPNGERFFDELRRHARMYGTELRPVGDFEVDYWNDAADEYFASREAGVIL